MAKNLPRSPLTGRFVSTENSTEAAAGKFDTYAAGLPVDNISGAASDATHDVKRHGPSADAEREPATYRRPVEIDANSGQPAGSLINHAGGKHGLHLQAAGDMANIRYLMGGE